MAETPTRDPALVAQPLRNLSDYLKVSASPPFGVLAWIKFALLIAVGVLGLVILFGSDDARGVAIGATLALLGLLGGGLVWVLNWVLICHEREMAALRNLARRTDGSDQV